MLPDLGVGHKIPEDLADCVPRAAAPVDLRLARIRGQPIPRTAHQWIPKDCYAVPPCVELRTNTDHSL